MSNPVSLVLGALSISPSPFPTTYIFSFASGIQRYHGDHGLICYRKLKGLRLGMYAGMWRGIQQWMKMWILELPRALKTVPVQWVEDHGLGCSS